MTARVSIPALVLAATLALLLSLVPDGAPAAKPVASDAEAFFVVRQDYRRCMYPFCGGVFVSLANGGHLRCPAGERNECYVANFDWSALGLSTVGETVVAYGALGSETLQDFGVFNTFTATQAWSTAASNGVVDGDLYEVYDNGIRCITTPCPSTTVSRLNSDRSADLSDFDLSTTGADAATLDAAWQAMSDPGIIVRGELSHGRDKVLLADELLLPGNTLDPTLYCEAASDCTWSVYDGAVSDPAECNCTFCPSTVVNTSTAASWADSYTRQCSDAGLICPQVRCAQPPALDCVANQCVVAP